ncbi:MAG: Fe(2+)-trafficking protein [Phycisphaeraceae bacterium]
MDTNDRIAQWEKMTQEAPDGMAWFSLGNAYKEADRLEDAAAALHKAVEMDPGLSRAYQVLGQALIALDKADEAGEILARGYSVAAERGDVMPQKAMGSLLEKLGKPVPQTQTATSQVELGGDQIIDRRTGRPGTRLPDPPMRGPLGKFIFDHYSQETWREWIGMGTKVINELRLDFSNAEHQKVYEQHMMEWLGVSEEEAAAYAEQST